MNKPTHTIAGNYCTTCSETKEWLETTNQPCNYLITAADVQPGDYLHTTTEGGKRGATIAVGSVSRDGDWAILHTALTAFRIPAGDNVTVDRY